MGSDPFPGLGLRPVELTDRATLSPYFARLRTPLSDYTFAQLYTWRRSVRIMWKLVRGHLCVFADGTGDLTLLLPPLGDTGSDAALAEAFELMDAYNGPRGLPHESRVEYASEELLGRFDVGRLDRQPMGADYVYDVNRMIDLAGGDLASKRQAKNRFCRNYEHRVEAYERARHQADCLRLLELWKSHQDAHHASEAGVNAIKRHKESTSVEVCLESAEQLGMDGIVVYVKGQAPAVDDWSIRGFTFGEPLDADQSSIAVEKTDLSVKGLAQFIFSEFCRLRWSDRPRVNVGDDWGLETLAWTKRSYRPVAMLQKYVLRRQAVAMAGFTALPPPLVIRPARAEDLTAALEVEEACFDGAVRLTLRQLRYLQGRPGVVFVVAEEAGRVVGEGIALVRHHRGSASGRIYSLAVRNECRGRKVGRRLLDAMLSELESRGVRRVYLEVEKNNAAAVGLYERSGFRATGTLGDYYGPGRAGIHMLRESAGGPRAIVKPAA